MRIRVVLLATMVALLVGSQAGSVVATSSSGTSLNECTKNGLIGGVKLFNGDNATGGDRVMCHRPQFTNMTIADYDFGCCGGSLYDIGGNFDDKANSMRIRADDGCYVLVVGYDNGPRGDRIFARELNNYSGSNPKTKFHNIPNDRLDAIEISTFCN